MGTVVILVMGTVVSGNGSVTGNSNGNDSVIDRGLGNDSVNSNGRVTVVTVVV